MTNQKQYISQELWSFIYDQKMKRKQKIVKKTLKTTYFWGPGGVPLSKKKHLPGEKLRYVRKIHWYPYVVWRWYQNWCVFHIFSPLFGQIFKAFPRSSSSSGVMPSTFKRRQGSLHTVRPKGIRASKNASGPVGITQNEKLSVLDHVLPKLRFQTQIYGCARNLRIYTYLGA